MRKSQQIKQLELEYEEPTREILIGFRQQNLSWDEIAVICGYSHKGMMRLKKALNIPRDDKIIFYKLHNHYLLICYIPYLSIRIFDPHNFPLYLEISLKDDTNTSAQYTRPYY